MVTTKITIICDRCGEEIPNFKSAVLLNRYINVYNMPTFLPHITRKYQLCHKCFNEFIKGFLKRDEP